MALSDLLPTRRRKTDLGKIGGSLPALSEFQREMNRMFDDYFRDFDLEPFAGMEERLSRFAPSIDVSETPKKIKVTAELPGMEEKDISVTVEDDYLIISGERKEEEEKEDDERYYHREMTYGAFKRIIPFNAAIDTDKAEAKFKKGVLKITLPKIPGSESDKGRKIEIKTE